MVEDIEDNDAFGGSPEGIETGEDVIAALEAENAALKEQVLRYAAEADNTRRRAERESNDARAFAIQRFAKDLLEASDNLSRALSAAPADHGDPAVKNLVLGIEMTEKALQGAFERNGLKKVSPVPGDKFDPHLHQAMMEMPGEGVAPGAIVAIMQPGYELFGRIVRPAMVAVAPKAAAAAPPAEANGYAHPVDEAGGAFDTKA